VGGAQKRRLHRTVWRGSSRAASQSPALAGVAQLPGRWQGVSGADVDLLIVPLSASARVTVGVGGVTWR
jgi:hypothetical protein